MSCKICNRGSCSESFHSLAQQEEFSRLEEMLSNMSQSDLMDLIKENEEKDERINKLVSLSELKDELVYYVDNELNLDGCEKKDALGVLEKIKELTEELGV